MKVALTIWENRISPVFDSAHKLLVLEVNNEKIENVSYERLYPEMPQRMIEILKQINISVLICGAISEEPAYLIRSTGVKLIPFITGNVENVLDHFSKGKPITPKFLMPGCRGRYKEGKNMPKGRQNCNQGRLSRPERAEGSQKSGEMGRSAPGKGQRNGKGQNKRNGQGKHKQNGQGRGKRSK